MWEGVSDTRYHTKLFHKLTGTHDKSTIGSGRIRNLVVGADDRTIRPVLSCQPLDDLIRPLSSLRIDHVHSCPMFPLFGRVSLLPAVEHNGDEMILSKPISRQILHEHFAGRFKVGGKPSSTGQYIIPIDDHMRRHPSRYRDHEQTVNPYVG